VTTSAVPETPRAPEGIRGRQRNRGWDRCDGADAYSPMCGANCVDGICAHKDEDDALTYGYLFDNKDWQRSAHHMYGKKRCAGPHYRFIPETTKGPPTLLHGDGASGP
jgi:hypothetical protein